MHGPPLSPAEIRQILAPAAERYLALGLDQTAALTTAAHDFGAPEHRAVELLSEAEHPVERQSARCSLASLAYAQANWNQNYLRARN